MSDGSNESKRLTDRMFSSPSITKLYVSKIYRMGLNHLYNQTRIYKTHGFRSTPRRLIQNDIHIPEIEFTRIHQFTFYGHGIGGD